MNMIEQITRQDIYPRATMVERLTKDRFGSCASGMVELEGEAYEAFRGVKNELVWNCPEVGHGIEVDLSKTFYDVTFWRYPSKDREPNAVNISVFYFRVEASTEAEAKEKARAKFDHAIYDSYIVEL